MIIPKTNANDPSIKWTSGRQNLIESVSRKAIPPDAIGSAWCKNKILVLSGKRIKNIRSCMSAEVLYRTQQTRG